MPSATPLFFAIYGNGSTYLGSTDVVRFLLENGADPNLAHIGGVAPLHVATIRGSLHPQACVFWILICLAVL
jgi:ankyrin repeat protein